MKKTNCIYIILSYPLRIIKMSLSIFKVFLNNPTYFVYNWKVDSSIYMILPSRVENGVNELVLYHNHPLHSFSIDLVNFNVSSSINGKWLGYIIYFWASRLINKEIVCSIPVKIFTIFFFIFLTVNLSKIFTITSFKLHFSCCIKYWCC